MKTEYYTTKWLRMLELVSLIHTIFGLPIILFVTAIQFSILVPPEYVNNYASFILVLGALLLLFGFGIMFADPLKHYVQHKEKRDDVIKARLSFAFIFVDITIIFFSLMIYSRI